MTPSEMRRFIGGRLERLVKERDEARAMLRVLLVYRQEALTTFACTRLSCDRERISLERACPPGELEVEAERCETRRSSAAGDEHDTE